MSKLYNPLSSRQFTYSDSGPGVSCGLCSLSGIGIDDDPVLCLHHYLVMELALVQLVRLHLVVQVIVPGENYRDREQGKGWQKSSTSTEKLRDTASVAYGSEARSLHGQGRGLHDLQQVVSVDAPHSSVACHAGGTSLPCWPPRLWSLPYFSSCGCCALTAGKKMELPLMLCDWRDEARMQIEEAITPYQR